MEEDQAQNIAQNEPECPFKVLKTIREETAKRINGFDMERDYTLSEELIQEFRRSLDNVVFVSPHVVVRRNSGNAYEATPSGMVLRAALMVPFYAALKPYFDSVGKGTKTAEAIRKVSPKYTNTITSRQKNEAYADGIAILCGKTAIDAEKRTASEADLSYIGKTLVEELRQKYPSLGDSTLQLAKERIIDFLCDNAAWGGGKTIDRTDSLQSPILSTSKVIAESSKLFFCIVEFYYKYADAFAAAEKNIADEENSEKEPPVHLNDDPLLKGNVIVYGAPGTGKSTELERRAAHSGRNVSRIVFHSEYSYFDFVGSYKPVPLYSQTNPPVNYYDAGGREIGTKIPTIDYQFVPGPFTETLVSALKNPTKKYCLIIEEINRANAAAVFGDVFQLLDRDDTGASRYSIKPQPELANYLRGEGLVEESSQLRIPANMTICATMNNADQGVIYMDSAFKRRWRYDYRRIKLEENTELAKHTVTYNSGEHTMLAVLKAINDKMALSLKMPEDRLIGQYFITDLALREENGVDESFRKVLIYLWDDIFRNDRSHFFDLQEVHSMSDLFEKYKSADVLRIASELNAVERDDLSDNERQPEDDEDQEEEFPDE